MSMPDGPIIMLTQAAFDKLPTYSDSLPSGTYSGKQWKAQADVECEDNWWMAEYYMKSGDTKNIHIKWEKIVISDIGLKANEVVGTDDWVRLMDEHEARVSA